MSRQNKQAKLNKLAKQFSAVRKEGKRTIAPQSTHGKRRDRRLYNQVATQQARAQVLARSRALVA